MFKTIIRRFSTHSSGAPQPSILPCQRLLFDIPDDICYFNTSYMGPGLKSLIDAGSVGLSRKLHPWTLTAPDFFNECDELRSLIAQLFPSDYVSPSDIALVPSVSYGTATIAKNLPKMIEKHFNNYNNDSNNNKNDKNANTRINIVVLNEQFPSTIYCWFDFIKKNPHLNIELRFVQRSNPNKQWTQDVINNIDENTILVNIPNVHWSDGSLIDVKKISQHIENSGFRPRCHLLLDLTQTLGCMPYTSDDDSAWFKNVDFVVCAHYKWLLGPYTMSFMYMNNKSNNNNYQIEFDSLEQSWMNRDNSRDFNNLVNYSDNYANGALKFDCGQKSNLQLMPMAISALKQIHEWEPIKIYHTLGYYNNQLSKQMKQLGLEPMDENERGKHIMGIKFDTNKVPGDEILAALKEENVYASVRGNSIRIAPHLHCRESEFEKFGHVLAKVLQHHGLL